MGKLYIFRGKAATGKTVLTDLLSQELKICVLRKDHIYDMLSQEDMDHSIKNKLSYDILAKIINTNLKTNCEMIVDIALANTSHMNEFLSKLDLQETDVESFLCICSNEHEWKMRMVERIKNPTPNQQFKSVDDALRHYKNYEIKAMKDEIVIDSCEEPLALLEKVKKELYPEFTSR